MAEAIGTLLERGLRHYALGEIDRAVSCWREALQKDPDNARAREYLTLVRAAVPDVGGPVPLPPSRQPIPPERPSSPPPRTSGPKVAQPEAWSPTPPPAPPPAPAVEELIMTPDPIRQAAETWEPLQGIWSEAIPPGPGDATPGPELVEPSHHAEPSDEVEVNLELTPGMPPTPGPAEHTPLLTEEDFTPRAGKKRPEHSGGPFGRAEMFDLGLSVASAGMAQAAPSAWDVGESTPSFEIAIDGGDALGLVDGPSGSRSMSVAAPARAPEPPSPSSVANTLMQGARELFELGDFSGSLELVQKALDAQPDHRQAREYLERNQGTLIQMYESKLGSLMTRPRVMLKPDEIVWLTLDHRAGFVLAQIDGTVTYDDIFSVSSLPRLDTAKILAELLEQGVIAP